MIKKSWGFKNLAHKTSTDAHPMASNKTINYYWFEQKISSVLATDEQRADYRHESYCV